MHIFTASLCIFHFVTQNEMRLEWTHLLFSGDKLNVENFVVLTNESSSR